MKVLHLIDSSGLYGAEKAILALAGEQARRGMIVAVGSIGTPGERKHIELAACRHGIDVVRIEMQAGLSLGGIRRLRESLISAGCDVIHTHGYKPNVLMSLQVGGVGNAVHVITLHGWTSSGQWSRNAFYEFLDRRMLFMADAIAIVSESMRNTLPRSVRERTVCIRNGIPLAVDHTHEISSSITEFCSRAPTVVCVGRLSREKDQVTILRAMASNSRDSSTQALFLGDGPLRNQLTLLANDLGLGHRVLFAGYVEDAWRIFGACHAMVISSLTEGLPIALLEAMRARLPIISTPVGEIPMCTDGSMGAWFYPVGDFRALAGLISCVMTETGESAVRAQHSFRRFVDDLSIDHTADGYDGLYASVIGTVTRAHSQ